MHDHTTSALLAAHRQTLVRAAARLLGPAEAEDAVQDAYLRALEAQTLQLHVAQAWLLTVVRRLSIDRLRRRQWLQHWLADAYATETAQAAPSTETLATLAQEVRQALRLLAAHLTPSDAAAVLLHEVFEARHADIAQANGGSEAASRQRLRRSLQRLWQASESPVQPCADDPEPAEEAHFRVYLHALHMRDPQALWAMLRQPPIHAVANATAAPAMRPVAAKAASLPPATTCGLTQVGGQLALVLTLDGVTLCVLPLGTQPVCVAASQAH
jgi:RNA polymerase sigma factor (sigma-70 family)